MKKRMLLPLLAFVFVSLSSFTINPMLNENSEEFDCLYDASRDAGLALDLGYSDLYATCVGNVTYAQCAGWNASYGQCAGYLSETSAN